MIANPEWWVMRVMTTEDLMRMKASDMGRAIEKGELAMIGADVCQPIECYDTESQALARATRETSAGRGDHKVVLSAEVVGSC